MIEIVRADITTLEVDCIVNAANAGLTGGGGVDGAIHRAAGPQLQEFLDANFDGCPTGDAVLSPGFDLPASWVVHAVGPRWSGGQVGEAELLASAYRNAFRRATENGGIESIATCAISTGVYGYPRAEAARIAVGCLLEQQEAFGRVIACLFDDESLQLYRQELARRSGRARA